MDLINEEEFERNILHWYPVKKDSSILQIGNISIELIKELCMKFQKVTLILDEENQKQEIFKNINISNLNIHVVQNLNNYSAEQYDYISLIGTLEVYNHCVEEKAYKKLEKILDFSKQHCKESGKILLAVNNKYGMKSWTTLKANKNIICNQTYSLSKTLIDKLLKEKNLKEYKYYYILPDYKVANVVFTDKYLPNLESINRNFLYGEEKFENFNQTEAYIELLKENPQSFKFFANSFFVEIAKNKLEENRNKICIIYKYSKRRI